MTTGAASALTGVGGSFGVTLGNGGANAGAVGGSFNVTAGSGAGYAGATFQVLGGTTNTLGYVNISPFLRLANTTDPAQAAVSGGYLYSKVVGGVGQLFWKSSDGTIHQITS